MNRRNRFRIAPSPFIPVSFFVAISMGAFIAPAPAQDAPLLKVLDQFTAADVPTLGEPSALSCPVCGGVLNEVLEEGTAQFRCQTGHAFTSEGLVVAQSEGLERALASAARTHRDRLTLCRRMEEQARARAQPHSAARWHTAAEEAGSAAAAITAAIDALRNPAVR